ncbi:MAG: DUF6191 domain-containing protein [Actinomycetota bacterium]
MTQWGLDTLFNPAKRHMDEEKRRLQTTREQLGDSSGGKRIDLESGKVVIHRASDDGDDQSVESAESVSDPTDSPHTAGDAESRDSQ